MSDVLEVPVFSLRRIETPFERQPGYKNYVAVVAAKDLPDLSGWRKINVRDPKTRGRVPTAIRRSFDERPTEFLFMNRGLVLSADKVEFTERSGHEKLMKLTMKDEKLHGLLDGGHTYRIVLDSTSYDRQAEQRLPYVRIEIITGLDHESIGDVVEARNTSNQVKDESLANLRGKFDRIKKTLEDQPYFDLIAWSEYEELTSNKAKPIDIRDLISYLVMFDVDAFDSTKQPLIAYKDKRACLRHFERHEARLRGYYHLLPEILYLWDEIHDRWFDWYRREREENAGIKGRPGALTGVIGEAPQELYFKGKKAEGRIPDAYKYPILNALRAAIRKSRKKIDWALDPRTLLDSTGTKLVGVVGNAVRTYNNANKVGKDIGTWSSCYLIAESNLRDSVRIKQEATIQELRKELEDLKRSTGA